MRDAKRLVDAGTQVLAFAQLDPQLYLLTRLEGRTDLRLELSKPIWIVRQVKKAPHSVVAVVSVPVNARSRVSERMWLRWLNVGRPVSGSVALSRKWNMSF